MNEIESFFEAKLKTEFELISASLAGIQLNLKNPSFLRIHLLFDEELNESINDK